MRTDQVKIRLPINKEIKNDIKNRVSTYTESYKGEYYNIDIEKLIPFKQQSRKSFDQKSLEKLSQTIKAHGIRQPLTILPSEMEEGKYEIVSGERRWRAAKLIKLKKLPCIILKDRNAAEEIALIENIQRKSLHPLELMSGLQNLLDKGICKNQQEIADKIGVSRSVVVETLKLKDLPQSTQTELLEKKVKSRDVLRQLLKSPQQDHVNIIKEGFEKNKKIDVFSKAIKTKKNKLISIYIQDEQLFVDESKKFLLTKEQKEELKNRLQSLVEKI